MLENGAKLIGLGARDTLRLEAGLCLYGHELSTETTPIEANLKWAISKERLNNGGFIGSQNIISQINDGVKKIRVGIKPEGRLIAREKTKIYDENEQMIGEVTSGTFGPSVNGPIAMGFVDKNFSKKETKIFLEVRGKKYPANVCGLPFILLLLNLFCEPLTNVGLFEKLACADLALANVALANFVLANLVLANLDLTEMNPLAMDRITLKPGDVLYFPTKKGKVLDKKSSTKFLRSLTLSFTFKSAHTF